MSQPLFTVFTPTYNRAHTLPRLYASLLAQTARNFEWLVIDDGSSDGTRELVEGWTAEGRLPIRYRWQENAHKKVAFNRAVREARGALLLPVDSDDAPFPNALATLEQLWQDIPHPRRSEYSAVTVLCVNPDGGVVGSRFPAHQVDTSPMELRYRHRVRGDKWGFQRVDVLRLFPFPEDVRGLVPESIVWDRIGRQYLTRYVDIPLLVVHPTPESLTRTADFRASVDGLALLAREVVETNLRWFAWDPIEILKRAAGYTRFSLHLAAEQPGKRWPLKHFSGRMLAAAMWPIGMALFAIDRFRLRHV